LAARSGFTYEQNELFERNERAQGTQRQANGEKTTSNEWGEAQKFFLKK